MNWVHLHLALNHIPVLGVLFLFLLLCVGVLRASDELKRTSLAGFVLLTVVAIPIKFTGDFAYEAAAGAPWLIEDLVEAHERSADQATTAIFVLGLVTIFGCFRGRGGKEIPRWIIIVTLALALGTCCMMARTAYLGGHLRHSEIRP